MNVEERLRRLELENHRLKTWGAIVVVVLLVVGGGAASSAHQQIAKAKVTNEQLPDVIWARGFIVYAEDKTPLVKLSDFFGANYKLINGGVASQRRRSGTIELFNGSGGRIAMMHGSGGNDPVGMLGVYDPEDRFPSGHLRSGHDHSN